MNHQVRTVFIISDGTGITAETFSHSILAQFEIRFKQIRLPFINSIEGSTLLEINLNADKIWFKTHCFQH
jgi:regulator of PEP synthase PpsR (kinase-PPPase family)